MKLIAKVAITLASVVMLAACKDRGPVTVTPLYPILEEIRYDSEFNIKMRQGRPITQFTVSGQREFSHTPSTPANKLSPYKFGMNDPEDRFWFTIYDEDGVRPGARFTYRLQVVDPRTLAILWTDTLEVAVPSSYGEVVRSFRFEYGLTVTSAPTYRGQTMKQSRVYAADPSNPAGLIGGDYQITTTSAGGRYVSFSIRFDIVDRFQVTHVRPIQEVPTP